MACSKPEKTTGMKITPPIYVATDPDGLMFFGPISMTDGLSNGEKVTGTDNTISVFCSSLTDKEAILTFRESAPGGALIRETTHPVPLGLGFTFKIFDTVKVTIKNSI
jgi:hypothetical protein